MEDGNTVLITKIRLRPENRIAFADWQARLNALIVHFPGFISLEILSPQDTLNQEWVINQRFKDSNDLWTWCQFSQRKQLINELQVLCSAPIHEAEVCAEELPYAGVTEVFITEVSPEKDQAYKEWIAKVHQVEAKFPGFRGVYVQSPGVGNGKNWMTFLQFDSPENLDRWLSSPEREAVLKESIPLIASIESHRVITSYSGWFASIAKDGQLPPVWKQTMLVLLVLFPIVMLQLKYLIPQTIGMNQSLATFIANTISVTLISWPMMPIAIFFLGWWLLPTKNKGWKTLFGIFIVLLLYLGEVLLFWNLL